MAWGNWHQMQALLKYGALPGARMWSHAEYWPLFDARKGILCQVRSSLEVTEVATLGVVWMFHLRPPRSCQVLTPLGEEVALTHPIPTLRSHPIIYHHPITPIPHTHAEY